MENEPKLLIVGRSVEIKYQLSEIRLYLANENTIKQVNELLSNGARLQRVFDKADGKVLWETKS